MLQFPQGYQDFQKYFSSCRFFIYVILPLTNLIISFPNYPRVIDSSLCLLSDVFCKTAFVENFRNLKRKHLGKSLVLRSLSSFGPLIGSWSQKTMLKKKQAFNIHLKKHDSITNKNKKKNIISSATKKQLMVAKKHFTYPQILMDAQSGPQETFEMESFCNNRYKLKVASDCYKALHIRCLQGS